MECRRKIRDDCIAAHSVALCQTTCVGSSCSNSAYGGHERPGCHDKYWEKWDAESNWPNGRDWEYVEAKDSWQPKDEPLLYPNALWDTVKTEKPMKCSNCGHCHGH